MNSDEFFNRNSWWENVFNIDWKRNFKQNFEISGHARASLSMVANRKVVCLWVGKESSPQKCSFFENASQIVWKKINFKRFVRFKFDFFGQVNCWCFDGTWNRHLPIEFSWGIF